MNFGQLQTAVYQLCGYPSPVQPAVVSRVKNWINEAHRHCLRLPGLVELRQRSGMPFTSVAGQAIYSFHAAFERIDAVVERTTQRRLQAISRDVFRSIDPAETSQGTPTCYAPEGWQCRFALPFGAPRDLRSPGAPTVANTGVGTYPAIPRIYRVGLWVRNAASDEILHQTMITGELPSTSFVPSGTGTAVRITRPPDSGQGETEWIPEVSLDGVEYYAIAILSMATPYFDDAAIPESYSAGPYLTFPSAPVYAASNSALDITQVVRLQMLQHGELLPPVQVTLTGLNRVYVSGGIDLVALSLSSTCAGDVTFYDQRVGGRSIARIPAGQTSAQYWCLRLWPTPSGPVTYYVDGQIEIPELVHETDIPMLPPSYHDLLAAFARSREYERTGDSRFSLALGEWDRGVALLRSFVNFPDDWKPVAGSMSPVSRGSNLGGAFPADWGWP